MDCHIICGGLNKIITIIIIIIIIMTMIVIASEFINKESTSMKDIVRADKLTSPIVLNSLYFNPR